jgi:RNA polymerase sigma-70 factor (ECF subfamily)
VALQNRHPKADDRNKQFELIFGASYSRVFAYALRRSGNRELAEEVVAETFLIAWRRLDELPDAPLPWLLGTARRVFANHARYTKRRSRDGAPIPLDYVEAGDPSTSPLELIAERQAFVTAFKAMRAEDREVLVLIGWDGLDAREAAKVLGCSTAAFTLRLHRARRRLQKEMALHERPSGEGGERLQSSTTPGPAEAP